MSLSWVLFHLIETENICERNWWNSYDAAITLTMYETFIQTLPKVDQRSSYWNKFKAVVSEIRNIARLSDFPTSFFLWLASNHVYLLSSHEAGLGSGKHQEINTTILTSSLRRLRLLKIITVFQVIDSNQLLMCRVLWRIFRKLRARVLGTTGSQRQRLCRKDKEYIALTIRHSLC